jgi:hypothetical protein
MNCGTVKCSFNAVKIIPKPHVILDMALIVYTGKVDKKRLLQWYNARLQVIQSSNTGPLVDNIRQLVCRLWQVRQISFIARETLERDLV